jgi:hypothetical protein
VRGFDQGDHAILIAKVKPPVRKDDGGRADSRTAAFPLDFAVFKLQTCRQTIIAAVSTVDVIVD